MLVFLNGRFLPESEAVVSVFDRGFLYGDGLFETLRVLNGVPFRWREHLARLDHGAETLKISLPFDAAKLHEFADHLIKANQMPDALLRLTLSRGVGARGYSPKGADRPSLVMSLHAAPPLQPNPVRQSRLMTSSMRLLANDPMAQFKTCNKLPHIVARAEAESVDADEAVLLNSDGFVAEGTSSNLFWLDDGTVFTPPLCAGVLPGITRSVVLELSQSLGLTSRETNLYPRQLCKADGVFLTLSSMGLVEATAHDGKPLKQSPLTHRLRLAYLELIRNETGRKSPDSSP